MYSLQFIEQKWTTIAFLANFTIFCSVSIIVAYSGDVCDTISIYFLKLFLKRSYCDL